MTVIDGVIALALIGCAGWGIAALLVSRRGTDATELLGLSVIFGGAFISFAMFGLGFCLPASTSRWSIAFLAIALAVWARFRARPVFEKICPTGVIGGIFLIVLLLQIAFVSWQSITHTLGWDGTFCWEVKAHIAGLNGGRLPLSYFTDLSRAWSHPQYPPALPTLEEWLYSWIRAPHQGWAKVLFPFVYIAAAALLCSSVQKFTRDPRLAFAAATLPFFVPCLVVGPGSASSGWGDFPLATVYLAAVIYLLEYAKNSTPAALRLLAVCAAILPWVKQEGVILAGSLFAIGFVVSWPRREILRMVVAAIPTLFVVCGWRIFLACVKAPPQSDFLPFTPEIFFQNAWRLAVVVKFLAKESIRWDRWGLLWIAAPIALADLSRRGHEKEPLVLISAILLPITLYSGVYIFSAWPDYFHHLSSSMPRLIMDVALVAVLAVGMALPARGRDV